MDQITNFDKFDAPCIEFSDLPDGMGEKVQVGDVITATDGAEKTHADVIEVDRNACKIYLSKELPDNAELSVEEKSHGQQAPYDAMKKAAQLPNEDVLTGPLSDLKKFIISISIEEK